MSKLKSIDICKSLLEDAILKYVKLFEKKHDLSFEFWVLDVAGTIACFSNEYYINFDDLRIDLEQDVPKELFIKWYDESLEQGLNNEPTINYRTFLKIKQ